jgi:hypothetical protein
LYVGLLISNGGPPSPEQWAGVTVQRFIDDFSEDAPAAVYAEVERFRSQIDRIISEAHRIVQTDERAALESDGPDHIVTPIDHTDVVDSTIEQIMAMVSQNSPRWPSLKAYFDRPETTQYFQKVLHREFHLTAWSERSWASHDADTPKHPNLSWHKPNNAACQAFRGVVANGHALLFLPHAEDAGKDVVRLSPLTEYGGRAMVEKIVAASIPGPHPSAPAQSK